MEDKLNSIFNEIKKRYSELQNSCDKESLLKHLHAISQWNKEPMDYPEITNVAFPKDIHIAHAVCHPDCGTQEFIVDGSTQRCQRCGGLMFRGETEIYQLKEGKI